MKNQIDGQSLAKFAEATQSEAAAIEAAIKDTFDARCRRAWKRLASFPDRLDKLEAALEAADARAHRAREKLEAAELEPAGVGKRRLPSEAAWTELEAAHAAADEIRSDIFETLLEARAVVEMCAK